ncbi:MAG TPA: hypothetical protein VE959_34095 [Bryobacteraceae bacterium]|nr:hypothetical protein [Bryobacteraceae bacterium]
MPARLAKRVLRYLAVPVAHLGRIAVALAFGDTAGTFILPSPKR